MNIQNYITKSEQTAWNPLVEKGVHYPGLFVKSLRFDPETNRSKTILLKFSEGARYPYHVHPAGEEIFVLEGSCEVAGAWLEAGDHLYTPPSGKHGVYSADGCVLLLSIPEEVILLES